MWLRVDRESGLGLKLQRDSLHLRAGGCGLRLRRCALRGCVPAPAGSGLAAGGCACAAGERPSRIHGGQHQVRGGYIYVGLELMGQRLGGLFYSFPAISGPDGYPRGRYKTRTRPVPFRVPELENPRGENCTCPSPCWVGSPQVSGPNLTRGHPYAMCLQVFLGTQFFIVYFGVISN